MPGGFVGLSGLANVGFRAHSVYAARDEALACGGWACFGRGGAGGVCALCTQHLARTDPAQHCQLVDLDRGGRVSLCKLFFRRSTHVDLDPDRLCDRAVRDCDSVVFYGQKGKTWIDSFCLLAAAVSLFLWWQTGSAKLALGLNILVDACGAIPTLRKSWQQPESEDRAAWFLFLLAGVLNVIAVTPWTWATAAYPLYLVLNSGVMNLILLRKT